MVLPEEPTGRQAEWPAPAKGVQDGPPRKAVGISKPSQLDYLGCHRQHRVQAVTSKASRDTQRLEPQKPSQMPPIAELSPLGHSHGSHSHHTGWRHPRGICQGECLSGAPSSHPAVFRVPPAGAPWRCPNSDIRQGQHPNDHSQFWKLAGYQ